MESANTYRSLSPELRKNVMRRALQVLFTILFTAFILFVCAGSITWIWAWIYIAIYMLMVFVNFLIFPPEVVAERGSKKENVEHWDKIVSIFLLIPWIAIYVIPGLDHRFGWTPETPLWSHLAGVFFFLPGISLVSWAMVSNPFFSTSVRIQYERDHKVAEAGPYRFVRHPGYIAMIVYNLVTPLIFGSYWTFIPAVMAAVVVIVRTKLEDDTLKQKLPGYREYSERTRYRMIPFIW